jgi:hypothetical protein
MTPLNPLYGIEKEDAVKNAAVQDRCKNRMYYRDWMQDRR